MLAKYTKILRKSKKTKALPPAAPLRGAAAPRDCSFEGLLAPAVPERWDRKFKNNKRSKYDRIELLNKKIEEVNKIIHNEKDKNKNNIYFDNIKEMKKEINKLDMSIISITKDDIILIKNLFDNFIISEIQYYKKNR